MMTLQQWEQIFEILFTLSYIKLHHFACPPVQKKTSMWGAWKPATSTAANEKKMSYTARGKCLDCLVLHCGESFFFAWVFFCFAFEKSTCTLEWTNCMNIAPAGKLTMGSSSTGRAQISRKKLNKAFYWDVCVCLEFYACLLLFQSLGGLFYVTELLPEDSKIIE